MDPDKQAPSDNGRDKGRFKPGVSGNPAGRPRGTDARAEFTKAKGDAATSKTVVDIMSKLAALAIDEGDVAAAREVLNRLCGPVRSEVDLTVDDPSRNDDRDKMLAELAAILTTAAARRG